jgi:esterase/lipase superfamily enzyme
VLVLAANPQGTSSLQLAEEAESIRRSLQEGETGQTYVVKEAIAVRASELQALLLLHKPRIVHFSGHGNQDGSIVLEQDHGQAREVAVDVLAECFRLTQERIECVVLNACYSAEPAQALAAYIRHVIGMRKAVGDNSARQFAAGFYRGLAFNKSYQVAYEMGRNNVALQGLTYADMPQFIIGTGPAATVEVRRDVESKPIGWSSDLEILRGPGREAETPVYLLWFGTNREPVDAEDYTKGFTGERDQRIHYGTCRVAIPESHKIGSIGSPFWKRLLTWTDDRLRLDMKSLQVMSEWSFWSQIKHTLAGMNEGERMALVFIHGYNVSFEGAALRAAQIGYDLQVPGITAFYSWPSKGTPVDYAADAATIDASVLYMTEFLRHFIRETEAERVHLIAHSMGNRGLLQALQRVVKEVKADGSVPFGQIFLAAPDVDLDVFRDLASVYKQLSERTTLYVSSRDKALASSGFIHDHPRAGFVPPVTIVPGIDTIEVSSIDLTLLGHGYVASARSILSDMSA